jgi:hypothetical protein
MPLNLVIGYKSRKSPEGAAVLICTNDGDAARAILDATNPDFPVRELVIRPQATKRRTDESVFPMPPAQESEGGNQESEKAPAQESGDSDQESEKASDQEAGNSDQESEKASEEQPKKGKR